MPFSASRVPKLLYVSSVSALGSAAQDRLANEESEPYGDPRWPISFASREETLAAVESSLAGDYTFIKKMRVAYFDAKLAGWELAKLHAREKGLPVITVFPGTVVGAGDQAQSISNLVDKVWEGKLSISLPGASSFVAARDFARGAVLALARGRIGEGYVISGRDEHNMRYADFMRLISTVAYTSDGYGGRATHISSRRGISCSQRPGPPRHYYRRAA
jgi:nucleoside-diphosphate-sugar epimerase